MGSLRSPNSLNACSEIGNTSTPLVFFCLNCKKYPSSSLYCTSPQTSFEISENLNPVRAENIAAFLSSGIEQGVFTRACNCSSVKYSRCTSGSLMPSIRVLKLDLEKHQLYYFLYFLKRLIYSKAGMQTWGSNIPCQSSFSFRSSNISILKSLFR